LIMSASCTDQHAIGTLVPVSPQHISWRIVHASIDALGSCWGHWRTIAVQAARVSYGPTVGWELARLRRRSSSGT